MDTGTVVWLAVLTGMGLLFLITLRRMSALVGRTRDLERYQRTVRQLDRRLAATVEPFVLAIDQIRRRSGDPRTLADELPEMQDTLRAIAAEGRAAKVPRGLTREAVAFTVELERAVRAAELVGHGLDALLADRGGRDFEAQTHLKRGALNLRHAREAASHIAVEILALRPVDLLDREDQGAPPTAGSGVPRYVVDEGPDDQP